MKKETIQNLTTAIIATSVMLFAYSSWSFRGKAPVPVPNAKKAAVQPVQCLGVVVPSVVGKSTLDFLYNTSQGFAGSNTVEGVNVGKKDFKSLDS